jgi:recombination protein RecA
MGDGVLSPTRSGLGARFRMGHGATQSEYCDWKASLFANIGSSRSTSARGAVFHDVTPLVELAELRQAVYVDGKKVFGHDHLKQLTPLSLAVWYQDDGTFAMRAKGVQARTRDGSGRSEICVEAMEPGTRQRLLECLADTWGIQAKLTLRGPERKAVLTFPKDETAKLHALIAPFVHPTMQYKLLPRYRGQFAVEPVFVPERPELVPMPIVAIGPKPPSRSTHRFDLEVAGTHNYFVDGVMVHNSPETTPGGRALKFYASVRLDVRRIESIKDGAEVVGNRTRVKVVKNKCFAAGTLVFDPTTGLTHPIEEIVAANTGTHVMAADKLGKLHVRPIVQRFDQGEAECIGLRLRDGTVLRVTADHTVLTDKGWRAASDLGTGDRVARPRRALGFGDDEPVSADHARLLGYLIGDGCVGGKTPISFVNIEPILHADVARIASDLGCDTLAKSDIEVGISHRQGEKNGVLALARSAGIWGHLAPEKRIPAPFFDANASREVIANLIFGIWETDGWVSREQTGALRVGFTTTSAQLAQQLHWLLLRWGIGSSVRLNASTARRPSLIKGRRVQGKLPCWEVRVSGVDNVERFAAAIPLWGPHGQVLAAALAAPDLRCHRGSQRVYLPANLMEPVLTYLRGRGVTPAVAASFVGAGSGNPRGGLRQVLGHNRLRRDRIQRLAEALDSEFLRGVLDEDVWYDRVVEILPAEWLPIYDVEVEEHHSLVAGDVVASNCSAPFRQAEFDIMYGRGISREGSLLDVAVEIGLVKKSGAWFTYEGEQLGQGRENAKVFLADSPEVMVEIAEKIRQHYGLGDASEAGDATIDLAAMPAMSADTDTEAG